DAEDRGLPRVQDRGAGVDVEDAVVGDGDGAVAGVAQGGAAGAGGAGELADPLGELPQGHQVGVLEVRHDESARGGGGDAEVHVVLVDDLLGGLVPGGVDLGVAADGDQQRLRDHRQRADLHVGPLPGGAQLGDDPQ